MLRIATKDDIETIKKLYNNFIEEYPDFGKVASLEEIEAFALSFLDETSPDRMVVLAFDESGEAVGMVAFSYEENRLRTVSIGHRDMIWVEKDHRKEGYSKELMNAFHTWATSMECNLLRFNVLHDKLFNKMSKFYKDLGYRPIDTTFIKEI